MRFTDTKPRGRRRRRARSLPSCGHRRGGRAAGGSGGASAHGFSHWGEPGATAPDGHYIVSISWEMRHADHGVIGQHIYPAPGHPLTFSYRGLTACPARPRLERLTSHAPNRARKSQQSLPAVS